VALDRVETVFLAGQVSDTTRATLDKETGDPQIIGATLDDPVKQVNLSLLTVSCWARRNFKRDSPPFKPPARDMQTGIDGLSLTGAAACSVPPWRADFGGSAA